MLALSAVQGDYAVRSDTSQTYVMNDGDPTQLSNWTLIGTTAAAAPAETTPTSTTRITKSVQADAGTTTLSLSNIAAPTTRFLQQDAISNVRGTYVRYLSSGSIGSDPTFETPGIPMSTLPDITFVWEAWQSYPARYACGLSGFQGITSATNGADFFAHLAFLYDSSVDSTWRFQANAGNDGLGDGTERTTVDTGVAFAHGTRYVMRVEVVSLSLVRAYINGTKVAEVTTQLPSSFESPKVFLGASNQSENGAGFLFSKCHVQHN